MNNLTEYIKKAFDYKEEGLYKEAIDYFYKALAIDNESNEIMNELAFLYSKLHQYDRAVSFYEQILSKNPDDYKTNYNFAMLYKKMREYDKAQAILDKLYEKDSENINIAQELFFVLLEKKSYEKILDLYLKKTNVLKSSLIYYYVAMAYYETNREQIAEEFFKKSFETDENNIESGCYIAQALFDKGLYQESEELLKKLLKHSENDKIFFLLGEISYLKSDFDTAINYWGLATKLNDKNAQYFYKLGVAFSLKGFLNESQNMFQRAITLEHNNLLYNYTLAYSYYTDKKPSFAMRIIDFILSLSENYLPALSLKLIILLDKDDISDADKIVDIINSRYDKDEYAYYAVSLYYSKINLWQNAINNIQKAINHNPVSCEYNFELAKCYFNIKEYEKAIETCNFVISKNNKYINAYILLANIYYEKNLYDEAKIYMQKALDLDINCADIYSVKAGIEEKTGKIKEAILSLKTAISLCPSNSLYYSKTAKLYFLLKEWDNAYQYFKESSDIDVTNAENRYYMAKCCEYNNDSENAIVNYSLARRLLPNNEKYLTDYIIYLCKINKRKTAEKVLKSSLKYFNQEEKIRLKSFI